MATPNKDIGTIQVLLDRLNKIRLPRALELQTKVRRGECLDDADKEFLQRVMDESKEIKPLVARNPKFEPLVQKLTVLYAEITSKGLENEKKAAKH